MPHEQVPESMLKASYVVLILLGRIEADANPAGED